MATNNDVWLTSWGALTSIGSDEETIVDALRRGQSGFQHYPLLERLGLKCQIAGQVPEDPQDCRLPPPWDGIEPRLLRLGLLAAEKALKDAGLRGDAARELDLISAVALSESATEPKEIPALAGRPGDFSLLSEALAERWQIEGVPLGLSGACASGLDALGEAFRWIQHGESERVLVVASEAFYPEMAALFDAWGAMPTGYNDDPAGAGRAFDGEREGFVYAPGAAAVLLESAGSAREAGRRPLARISGFSAYNDGCSMIEPSGEGLAKSIRGALKQANLRLSDIDYISPHGAGTRLGDRQELTTLLEVASDTGGIGESPPWISSTKALHGHAMGAAGLIEVTMAILMMKHGFVSPLPNLVEPMPQLSSFRFGTRCQDESLHRILSCNMGLGGVNSCVVLEALT